MADTNIKGAFGSTKSESGYVSSRIDVQSARTKFSDANLALILAKRSFDSARRSDKNYQALADAVKSAQKKLDDAKIAVDAAVAAAKSDYQKQLKIQNAKKEKSEQGVIDKKIEAERIQLQRLVDSGQSTVDQEAVIQDLVDKKNKTGKYAPAPEKGDVVGDQQTNAKLRDYQTEITNAANYIRKMSPADRLNLAKVLTNAGFYNGPLVNTYSDTLVNAYKTALGANYSRSTQWGEEVPWLQFVTDKITETNAAKAAAGGGGPAVPQGTVSISTPSEAAAKVEAAFLRELKRLPTAEELTKFSADLIKEESKKSSITKTTQKKVGGVLVTEYTGGLDRDQFLSTKIRQLPEYNAAKVAAETLTIQSLANTARANGLDLNKNFSPDTISVWAKRVANGEDIDIFKNIIRQTAAVGMPDSVMQLMQTGVDLETIYSPYKRTMAAMLELPESSITLSDPTLRQAIGPEKPMNLYDYEKSLRKDSRWQYTKNAREEVASATLQVLRDFGFQG